MSSATESGVVLFRKDNRLGWQAFEVQLAQKIGRRHLVAPPAATPLGQQADNPLGSYFLLAIVDQPIPQFHIGLGSLPRS